MVLICGTFFNNNQTCITPDDIKS